MVLPNSPVVQSFYRGNDTKLLIHLQKVEAHKPWTPIKVSVTSVDKEPVKVVATSDGTTPGDVGDADDF